MTIRAVSFNDVFLSPKPLIKCTIPSGVLSAINQLLVIEFLQKTLDNDPVLGIGGANKTIIGNVIEFGIMKCFRSIKNMMINDKLKINNRRVVNEIPYNT